MRLLAPALLVIGCGDNLSSVPQGQPLAHADTLFVAAHVDDDMIFMQPELVDALEAGSVTTVYMTVGDPIKGYRHAQAAFDATKRAYGGDGAWECGYVALSVPVQHCRLVGREVSLVTIDLPDGGIPGERTDSLLHVVDGTVPYLPLLSPVGGSASADTIVDLAAEILTETTPAQIHALDVSAMHGRDHSSHLFSASFLLWGAARVGYAGPITWHRGYNVATEEITLDGEEYARAAHMLGAYEACATSCGPCGSTCPLLPGPHENWLRRQYASSRLVEAAGTLALGDACLDDALTLGTCSGATQVTLDRDGHLHVGAGCLASTDAGVTVEPCATAAAQYWVLDDAGSLYSGVRPRPSGDMSYDHVRCLGADGAVVTAPTCGSQRAFAWRFSESRQVRP